MNFGEKLKKYRAENNLTQAEFAKSIGVGLKTLYHYESGQRFPKQVETYERIAEEMGCDFNYLLEDGDSFITEVAGKYGQQEARKAQALTESLVALFAGGELTDEDKDSALQAITEAYWEAKEENKKYGRKKKK
jgi:transcriptional regulator with XRE-family HTH domain